MNPVLTSRQLEVLELIAEGMTASEIGLNLGISERTVHAHCRSIHEALGTKTLAGAVVVAMKQRLILFPVSSLDKAEPGRAEMINQPK
ncbi:MAG TPA: helix-turn-helix transcriptional regulator [Devosia sp.]|jgi:DNA-binding NarL/FixJ family response regulator|uniref:response regulator transcription factor n=1 Tax=Devosia sp. TaxID=1871048 RepID=UPI002F92A86C